MPPGRAKALLIVQVIIISTSKTLDLRRGWLRVGRVLSWGGGEERKVPAWDPEVPQGKEACGQEVVLRLGSRPRPCQLRPHPHKARPPGRCPADPSG